MVLKITHPEELHKAPPKNYTALFISVIYKVLSFLLFE